MNTPTYSDSDGKRYTTREIEYRIKKAAVELLDIQYLEHGYNFCSKCKRNDCKPIDVSHTISRKKAKEDGMVEKLWDLDNLEILGRKCHEKKDKLNLKFHED
jgi:5-methylcytosine-specific restriction endonuclease McrA